MIIRMFKCEACGEKEELPIERTVLPVFGGFLSREMHNKMTEEIKLCKSCCGKVTNFIWEKLKSKKGLDGKL